MEKEINVLIMDDNKENLQKCKEDLKIPDLNLTLYEATTFEQANAFINSDIKFHFVLTDLFLPMDYTSLHEDAIEKYKGQEIPYGFILALNTVITGIPTAILTDVNHHKHPIAHAISCLKNSSHLFKLYKNKNYLEAFNCLLMENPTYPETEGTEKPKHEEENKNFVLTLSELTNKIVEIAPGCEKFSLSMVDLFDSKNQDKTREEILRQISIKKPKLIFGQILNIDDIRFFNKLTQYGIPVVCLDFYPESLYKNDKFNYYEIGTKIENFTDLVKSLIKPN